MFGRTLYDDKYFSLTVGLLGKYRVLMKERGLTLKANREEGAHLLRTIEALRDEGASIEPGSKMFEELAQMFIEAIIDRHTSRSKSVWRTFFLAKPHELAQCCS
jgi:hypothetical protein